MTGYLKSFPEWRAECGMSIETTLTAESGPLAINSWTVEEWTKVPGVGKVLAGRLVESGPYKEVADISLVKGVSQKIVESLSTYTAG